MTHQVSVYQNSPTHWLRYPIFSYLSPLLLSLTLVLGQAIPNPVFAQEPQSKTNTGTADLEAKPTPFRGNLIPPEQERTMVEQLTRLEQRYELTLAAAGVLYQSEQTTTQLLESLESSDPEPARTLQVPARYAGIVRALNQAKKHRQTFQSLVAQGEYLQASQTWLKAKNTLTDNFPTGLHAASPQIRAIWLDRGTIVKAQSPDDLKPLFDRMQRAGVNVVFFETVNAGYSIYPSQVAPEQNPLTQGWDPLEAAIALAHERNMELHAWVWVFSAANQRHNEIIGRSKDYPGPVLEKNPTWAITDRDGNRPEWISGKSFMDPANPDVRGYLQKLFREIVNRYDVDGLQLDYIRYPFQSPHQGNIHGYSFEARRQFQKQYRVDPIQVGPGHRHWHNWLNFKAEQIDSFVQQTATQLKIHNPNLTISAAVFPMATQIRHPKLQQNWQRWVKAGWVDLLVPMTYAASAEALQTMTDPLFEEEFQGHSLTIPGLRLLNMPSHKTLEQVEYVQRSPTSGYALFAAAHFRSALASTLNRPALKVQTLLPHREPLKAAAIAYEGLQREWHYWLEKHAPQLELPQLQPWAEKVDQVSTQLTQLVDDPSSSQFDDLEAALAELQASSATWMSNSDPLSQQQVQQWNSRLQQIQRLLNYGQSQTKGLDIATSQAGE